MKIEFVGQLMVASTKENLNCSQICSTTRGSEYSQILLSTTMNAIYNV